MGLLRLGLLAVAANEGYRAYNRHQHQKQQQQGGPNRRNMEPGQTMQVHEANGYVHQSWCNGHCGMHCNDGQSSQQKQEPWQATTSLRNSSDGYYYNGYDKQQQEPPSYERSESWRLESAKKEKSVR